VSLIFKILDLLTKAERKKAALLLLVMIFVAFLDVMGVASIMPFTAVLANPELIHSNQILNFLYNQFGFHGRADFLWALGLILFLLMLFSLACRATSIYAQLRFTLMREYSISSRLLGHYLSQPYSWFLNQNSAALGKMILSEVNQVILGGVLPLLNLISQGTVSIIMVLMLLLIDPALAITVAFVLGLSYGAIFVLTNKFLQRIGRECHISNGNRFKVINEAFGAIKELKFLGLEDIFLRRFSMEAKIFARHQASERIIGQLPRFGLEGVAFGGMMSVLLYLMAKNQNIAEVLPIVALYAFAGYRLMPALQQVYVSVISLKFTKRTLDNLHADLCSMSLVSPSGQAEELITLHSEIKLAGISFSYDANEPAILRNVSLRIPAHSSIGFMGATGSGKSTLIDIIMGLLKPSVGEVVVDEKNLSDHNIAAWQKQIGYVPQSVYLVDDSIAANIAFGVPKCEIDHQAVAQSAKIANLEEVIKGLPNGYETVVGDRGIRLSGGQRQRIGIARALYRNPKILILDEATSALDNETESKVLDSIRRRSENITIIMVAHRLSTIRECDQICVMNKGGILALGNHEYLLRESQEYRNFLSPRSV
jgi:ABC-type multidrug transport system fused ATPase/permease subunit